ncbi:MAG: hypothetical protein RSB77_03370 [Bacilli bacterium]
MKKIIQFMKNLFLKNELINLFPKEDKKVLVECGGNYCSDCC